MGLPKFALRPSWSGKRTIDSLGKYTFIATGDQMSLFFASALRAKMILFHLLFYEEQTQSIWPLSNVATSHGHRCQQVHLPRL